MKQVKTCSVVVVTHNSRLTIQACLMPLFSARDLEVVVVDNASSDGTADVMEKEFSPVSFIPLSDNIGFGSACNMGSAISQGDWLFFLNPDAEVSSETIHKIVRFLEDRPYAGIVGASLVASDGRPLASVGDYPSIWRFFFDKVLALMARYVPLRGNFRAILGQLSVKYAMFGEPVLVPWVSGAALCCRRSAWEAIGGFDEKFFLYYEDVDLCLRASRAGWEVWHLPDAVVRHQSGVSFGGDIYKQKRIYYKSQYYFFRKHFGSFTAGVLWLFQWVYFRLALYKPLGTDRIGSEKYGSKVVS